MIAANVWCSSTAVWNQFTGGLQYTINSEGKCNAFAFSPSDKILVYHDGKMAVVISTENWKKRFQLNGAHSMAITSIVFSPDGSLIATTGYDGIIAVWDSTDGKHIRSIPTNTTPKTIIFNDDNSLMSVSTGLNKNTSTIWKVEDGSIIKPFNSLSIAVDAVWPKKSSLFVLLKGLCSWQLYDFYNDNFLFQGTTSLTNSTCKLNKNAQLLAMAKYCDTAVDNYNKYCLKSNVAIIDVATNTTITGLANIDHLESMVFSDDSRLFIIGTDHGSIFIIKIPSLCSLKKQQQNSYQQLKNNTFIDLFFEFD